MTHGICVLAYILRENNFISLSLVIISNLKYMLQWKKYYAVKEILEKYSSLVSVPSVLLK